MQCRLLSLLVSISIDDSLHVLIIRVYRCIDVSYSKLFIVFVLLSLSLMSNMSKKA